MPYYPCLALCLSSLTLLFVLQAVPPSACRSRAVHHPSPAVDGLAPVSISTVVDQAPRTSEEEVEEDRQALGTLSSQGKLVLMGTHRFQHRTRDSSLDTCAAYPAHYPGSPLVLIFTTPRKRNSAAVGGWERNIPSSEELSRSTQE